MKLLGGHGHQRGHLHKALHSGRPFQQHNTLGSSHAGADVRMDHTSKRHLQLIQGLVKKVHSLLSGRFKVTYLDGTFVHMADNVRKEVPRLAEMVGLSILDAEAEPGVEP